MLEKATHPCDACGGRGYLHPSAYLEPYVLGTLGPERGRCPVCLGAGSFPDRMPVADALADAETLRKVAWTERPAAWDALDAANVYGRRYQPRHDAIAELVKCARAAFRAVPGLRGEEVQG